MGHFDHDRHVYCQNDEVSPECTHGYMYAKGSPDTPTSSPQQAAPGDAAPHLAQREQHCCRMCLVS